MKQFYLQSLQKFFSSLLLLCLLTSCTSIKQYALRSVGEMFNSNNTQGNTFTRDNDPELVEQALPSFLKLTELLRDASVNDPNLSLAVGQLATMYAGGFLQPKLEQVSSFSQRKQLQLRSKAMFLRGRDAITSGLRVKYNNFDQYFEESNLDKFLDMMRVEDVPFLYWGSLAWLGAFALDPLDFNLLTRIYKPLCLLWLAMKMEPTYNKGSLHTAMVTVMGSLPSSQIAEAMSHSPTILEPFFKNYYADKNIAISDSRAIVMHHFERSVTLSKGSDPGAYLALAKWLLAHQEDLKKDRELFVNTLNQVININPDDHIANRLLIILSQRQAKILLKDVDEYFF